MLNQIQDYIFKAIMIKAIKLEYESLYIRHNLSSPFFNSIKSFTF